MFGTDILQLLRVNKFLDITLKHHINLVPCIRNGVACPPRNVDELINVFKRRRKRYRELDIERYLLLCLSFNGGYRSIGLILHQYTEVPGI